LRCSNCNIARNCSTASLVGSAQSTLGPPEETHSKLPPMPQASPQEVEQFLAMIRFEHRSRLAELEVDLLA
ncbi:MAG: hypothetical protein JXB07_07430, partial [Anaerolineae bacterium]|nr:hypothetical protein [Anaerolineae bacterium]